MENSQEAVNQGKADGDQGVHTALDKSLDKKVNKKHEGNIGLRKPGDLISIEEG
jgi:hypothetical protein